MSERRLFSRERKESAVRKNALFFKNLFDSSFLENLFQTPHFSYIFYSFLDFPINFET